MWCFKLSHHPSCCIVMWCKLSHHHSSCIVKSLESKPSGTRKVPSQLPLIMLVMAMWGPKDKQENWGSTRDAIASFANQLSKLRFRFARSFVVSLDLCASMTHDTHAFLLPLDALGASFCMPFALLTQALPHLLWSIGPTNAHARLQLPPCFLQRMFFLFHADSVSWLVSTWCSHLRYYLVKLKPASLRCFSAPVLLL